MPMQNDANQSPELATSGSLMQGFLSDLMQVPMMAYSPRVPRVYPFRTGLQISHCRPKLSSFRCRKDEKVTQAVLESSHHLRRDGRLYDVSVALHQHGPI